MLGVDVGGTFTDLVYWADGTLVVGKTPTTPDDQSIAVAAGAAEIAGEKSGAMLVHGTTVATNALLERGGASTALITDAGLEDVIEIGRQDRPSLYDSLADRPEPLVDRAMRFVAVDGHLAAEELARLTAAQPEAIAISTLYSFSDDERERAIETAVAAVLPRAEIARSSRVAPEFREFERTSTTVINAYLQPVVRDYLERLVARTSDAGLAAAVAVMVSSGGLASAGQAAILPASILLSGPAGGVVAAGALADALDLPHVVSFDMGGTSTDVCRIDHGTPDVRYERPVAGHPCRMPAVAIHTVGAGGGSLAWIDAGGALRVGPQSAGAVPGPACYRRGGTQSTVTDANAVLGRLGSRLAGGLRLDVPAARSALDALGLAFKTTAVAEGVLRIVEEHMADAVRTVSIAEGADPRAAHLVAFGGAGGLHATAVARALDMAGVVVPPHAGVFSALGLLLSPPVVDLARSITRDDDLVRVAAELEESARGVFVETTGGSPHHVELRLDVRYVGQSHETTVPYELGEPASVFGGRFHDEHERRNGFARRRDDIEVVTVRARASKPAVLQWSDLPPPAPAGDAAAGERAVVVGDRHVEAAVFDRAALSPGADIVGPAVIEADESTVFVAPGERAVVHDSGALIVEW